VLSGISIPAVRAAMEKPLSSNSFLRSALKDMNAKRRIEFMAGRICAARSLREMGVIAEFPLPVKDRLPVWPSGVLGSISHCATMAVAMTARRIRYCALGIDVESLIAPDVALEIQQCICCDEELISMGKHIPCQVQSLTLLFSAKEALYKALFPLVRQFKDFHAAELCNFDSGSVVLRLTHDWNSCWCAGTKIRVRYVWLGLVVISAVCIPTNLGKK
jgi:enterobactin synthetase component D